MFGKLPEVAGIEATVTVCDCSSEIFDTIPLRDVGSSVVHSSFASEPDSVLIFDRLGLLRT